MTFPTFLFAFLIALLYGALYHLIRGGDGGRLLLYLGLSVIGFVVGHLIGAWRGWMLIVVGSLNLGMETLGSLIFLVAGEWLSRIEVKRESGV
jgi:hypothetical protein